MTSSDQTPVVRVADAVQWRAWLETHHASETSAYLALGKKGTSVPTPTYDQSVEEALAFGWIDSTPKALDDDVYLLRFTPRKPRSVWAATNKVRVEALERDGRMAPPGRAAVEAAKADGSWDALADIETLTVPDDLAAALAANPTALHYFEAFPPSSRKIILYWIASAKRDETRRSRIATTVELAAKNERAAHWRPKQ